MSNNSGSTHVEVSDATKEEIGRQVASGYTAGQLTQDDVRVSWSIEIDFVD